MKILIYSLIVSTLFILSCQTAPQKLDKTVAGQWSAKALVRNEKTNESQVFDLDIISNHPQPSRIEVSTSLGIHLASIVLKEELIQISLPKQKKFYEGRPTKKALYPLLKVNIDPRLISAAIYQEPYPDWKCQADNGEIQKCSSAEHDEITWAKIDNSQRRVTIKGNGFEAQIQFKNYQKKTDLPAGIYALTPDSEFKTYKIK